MIQYMLVPKALRSATGQVPPLLDWLVQVHSTTDSGSDSEQRPPSLGPRFVFFIKLRLSIIVSYNSQFLNKCTCVPKEDELTKTLDRTLSQLRENPIQ